MSNEEKTSASVLDATTLKNSVFLVLSSFLKELFRRFW